MSEFRGRSVLTQSARVWVIHELEPVAMGIKWMLEQEADIQVIGTAKTPGFLPPGQVDVIVWGWEKTVGPGVLRNFPLPQTAVIALTGSADADVLRENGRGVSGFVTKRDMEAMLLAVRTVHRGGGLFQPVFPRGVAGNGVAFRGHSPCFASEDVDEDGNPGDPGTGQGQNQPGDY